MEFYVAYNYYENSIYFIILAIIGVITIICLSINILLKYYVVLSENLLTVFAFNNKKLHCTYINTTIKFNLTESVLFINHHLFNPKHNSAIYRKTN